MPSSTHQGRVSAPLLQRLPASLLQSSAALRCALAAAASGLIWLAVLWGMQP